MRQKLGLFLLFLLPYVSVNAQLVLHKFDDADIENAFIYDIKKENNSYLWFCTDNGIYSSDGLSANLEYQNDSIFPERIIDADQQLFLFNDGNIYKLNVNEKEISVHQDTTINLSRELIKHKDQSYFATQNKILYTTDSVYLALPKSYQNILDFDFDAQGRTWIAERQRLYSSCQSITTSINLNQIAVSTPIQCLEIINNHLWLGTAGSGIYYVNLSDYYLQLPELKNSKIIGEFDSQLYAKTNNTIYKIGINNCWNTQKEALNLENCKSETIIENRLLYIKKRTLFALNLITLETETISELPSNFYSNTIINFHPEVGYLIGSDSQGVLQIKNGKTKILSTANKLVHNQCIGISINKLGQVAIWSKKGGISFLNHPKEYLDYSPRKLTGNVIDVKPLKDEWWVSTEGYGILVFDNQLNLKSVINRNGAAPSNYLLNIFHNQNISLAFDAKEALLIEKDKAEKISPNYYAPYFSLSGKAIAVGDNIYFENTDGILLYHREKIQQNEVDFKLEKVLINGSNFDKKYTSSVNNNLRFSFTTICASPIYRPVYEYQYRLTPDEESWSDLRSGEFTINNLDYGDKTLQIRKAEEIVYEYKLTIAKPLIYQLWFWLLIVAIASIVIWLLVYLRTAALKRQNKILEEMVAQRTKQINKKNTVLEHLAYTISHDLKTPAYNILNLVKLHRKKFPDSEKFASMYEKAAEQILDKTLNSLEFLRTENASDADNDSFNLLQTIKKAEEPLQFLIDKIQATINIQVDDNVELHGNKLQWQSLFFNLLSNALKYSKKESPCHIDISYKQSNGFQLICIKDNGQGMEVPKKQKGKIFQKFSRQDEEQEGTGVGLTLVEQIIIEHEGELEVKSEIGVGTEFIIRLPSSS